MIKSTRILSSNKKHILLVKDGHKEKILQTMPATSYNMMKMVDNRHSVIGMSFELAKKAIK